MRHHGERLVRLVFGNAVGAGADRLAGVFEPVGRLVEGTRADDAGAEGGQAALQRDVGRRVDHAHGVAVDDLHPVKGGEQAAGDGGNFARQIAPGGGGNDLARQRQGLALHGGAGFAEHALGRERGRDILGGEFVAIVLADALAQGEFHRAVIDAAPGGGEAGLKFELALVVEIDQALDEQSHHASTDVGLFAQGVQRVGVGDLLDRHGHGGAGVALGDGEARQGGGGGRAGKGGAAGQSGHRWAPSSGLKHSRRS